MPFYYGKQKSLVNVKPPPPWITSIFVRHSKKHEKTNSFLEEVNYHGKRKIIRRIATS